MRTHHTFVGLLIRSVMAILLGIGLALLLNAKSVADDIHLSEIKTKTDLYKDVTVTGKNETDIFIVHSRGMANVKILDLDAETLWRVGLGPEPGSAEAVAATEATADDHKMSAALAKVLESAALPITAGAQGEPQPGIGASMRLPMEFQPGPEQLSQLMPFLIGGLAVSLLIYLFFCYCLKLIVQKTGTEPGLMVWLPILQLIPMLRAAGMSMVWFLFWISPLLVAAAIPLMLLGGPTPETMKIMGMLSMVATVTSLLQLLAMIVWCVKIVQARGKSIWLTIFLILPITNLFAFLYLAFSRGDEPRLNVRHDDGGKIVIHSAFSEA